jgi:hypothetical protein
MTSPDFLSDDFVQLVSALLDGDLSEHDHVKLKRMLTDNTTARASYYA